MKKFNVSISETMYGTLEIEAENETEARAKVMHMINQDVEGAEAMPDGFMNRTDGYKIDGVEEIK